MLKDILVIGASGFIGRYLFQRKYTFKSSNIYFASRDRSFGYYIDLNDNPECWILPPHFDGAIILASITSIKQCESDSSHAYQINVKGLSNLALLLHQKNVPSLYVSSSSVFGSRIEVPYENTPVCPNTVYGYTKAEAEKILLARPGNCILRASKVLGFSPLLADWKNKLQTGLSVSAFVNMYLAPIHISFLLEWISQWVNSPIHGIYHISSTDKLSYYQFSRLLCDYLSVSPKLILPIVAGPDSTPSILNPFQCALLGCVDPMSCTIPFNKSLQLTFAELQG